MPIMDFSKPHGDSRRYGVLSDGSTDDAAALQDWLNASAGNVVARLYKGSGNTLCGTKLNISSNTIIEIQPGAVLESTLDDSPILEGLGVSNVTIRGGEIVGVDGTSVWTSPTTNSNGLIHFAPSGGGTKCSNIRVKDVEISGAWCPISCVRVDRLWVQRCVVHDFMRYGVLASQSSDFHINNNTIYGTNVTADQAYGITATGDAAGGHAQERCQIIGNSIKDITPWSAIMTHDCSKLTIGHNTIENCRNGIDVGQLNSSNVVADVTIDHNTITLTSTDSWSGSAAAHFGILASGLDATHRIARAVISGNTVRNHGTMSGATFAGNPASFDIEQIDDANVTGNIVSGADNVSSSHAGFQFVGTIGRLTVVGNSVDGDVPNGGIRLSSVTCDVATIANNPVAQANASNNAVVISGSTIPALHVGTNPTNCTTPYTDSTSTLTFAGKDSGATSVADGGTITHRLRATPVKAFATCRTSGEFVSVTARGTTTITVAIKKHDNTAGTTQVIDWEVQE